MSIKAWSDIGVLQREIEPYNILSQYFKKIYIFSYGSREKAFQKDIRNIIIIIEKPKFIPVRFYAYLLPLIQRKYLKECGILKTNQIQGSIAAVISKILFKKKLVIRSGYVASLMAKQNCSNIMRRFFIYLEEYISYRFADSIIIASEINRDYIIKKYPLTSQKVISINNMINTSVFKPLKIKKQKKLIGYVGRLDDKQKNLYSLISAIKSIDARLVFVGRGPEKDGLNKFAIRNDVKLDIKDKIRNHDLPLFLNKLDIFVLPSRFEGNPKALLEAMSCGCAAIGCDVYGVNNVVKNMHNGLLCKPDPASLRKTILFLLKKETLKKSLGANARKTILGDYNINCLINYEIDIYKKLV